MHRSSLPGHPLSRPPHWAPVRSDEPPVCPAAQGGPGEPRCRRSAPELVVKGADAARHAPGHGVERLEALEMGVRHRLSSEATLGPSVSSRVSVRRSGLVSPGRVVGRPCQYAARRMDEVGDREAADGVSFEHVVRFERVDPAQQRFRFYELRWQPNLWGGVALVRVWGRLGTSGQTRVDHYPDRESARSASVRAFRQRPRRGYCLVSAD
jgi:predicted DNA-binding WGR domain protein